MAVSEFRYRRRVQFAETDLVGIVHFSWIARYMEEAEHALWREAGLSIAPKGAEVGYPRVSVSIDFKAPLAFEDEFEVHVRVESMSARSIRYAHTVRRGDTVIATGTMTAVCVAAGSSPLVSREIPEHVRRALGDGPVFHRP
jgi:YbgC/YbaW family acyl-CoA thioester hydrolase